MLIKSFMTYFTFFYPTASATAYGQRPKFVRAKHSATAEGENCAYGPTLQFFDRNYFRIPVGKADAIYLVFFHFLRSELCRRQNSNYARIMSGIPVGKAEVFNELIY